MEKLSSLLIFNHLGMTETSKAHFELLSCKTKRTYNDISLTLKIRHFPPFEIQTYTYSNEKLLKYALNWQCHNFVSRNELDMLLSIFEWKASQEQDKAGSLCRQFETRTLWIWDKHILQSETSSLESWSTTGQWW